MLSPPEERRPPPILTRVLNRGRVLYEQRFRLVPTKDQHLHRQQQCLHSENNGMDQANGIDHVQKHGLSQAQIAPLQLLVITGVGIRNALATGNHVGQASCIEGLHDNG